MLLINVGKKKKENKQWMSDDANGVFKRLISMNRGAYSFPPLSLIVMSATVPTGAVSEPVKSDMRIWSFCAESPTQWGSRYRKKHQQKIYWRSSQSSTQAMSQVECR